MALWKTQADIPSIYSPTHLSSCSPVHPSLHRPIHLPIASFHPSDVCPSLLLSAYPSIPFSHHTNLQQPDMSQEQLSSVQLLSRVRLFATPWTAARQASLSITSSWSLLKLMSIELVMPSNHLILCCPLLLPPSNFPSIRVISS